MPIAQDFKEGLRTSKKALEITILIEEPIRTDLDYWLYIGFIRSSCNFVVWICNLCPVVFVNHAWV